MCMTSRAALPLAKTWNNTNIFEHAQKYANEPERFHDRDFKFHENVQVLFHMEYGLLTEVKHIVD